MLMFLLLGVLPHLSAFSSGQSATLVIGQSSFTTSASATTSTQLDGPHSAAFDSHGDLWVADATNNRVLEYTAPFSMGEAASVVIGQSSFTTNALGFTSSALVVPYALAFDPSGNLWVADIGFSQVMEFTAPFSTGEAASMIIGINDLIAANSTTLSQPFGIAFDSHGDLWVADTGDNRVLEYGAPLSTHEAASLVIGQSTFTSSVAATTSTGLFSPTSIAFDSSGNLWVGDEGGFRVLEYTVPFSTGEAATIAIGQSGFTTATAAATSTGLSQLFGIAFDSSGNLWVADSDNNRVMEYSAPFATGEAANLVIGQPGFTTSASGTSATQLSQPDGIAFDPSGNLWVVDEGNNRVVEFSTPAATTTSSTTTSPTSTTSTLTTSTSSTTTTASTTSTTSSTSTTTVSCTQTSTGLTIAIGSCGCPALLGAWNSTTDICLLRPGDDQLGSGDDITIPSGASVMIPNDAFLDINGTGSLTIAAGGTLVIGIGGALEDYATVTNHGTINDSGQIQNRLGANLVNYGAIDLINAEPQFGNHGAIINAGTINNSGAIDNNGDIENNGVISNECGGTLTNEASFNIYNGAAPTSSCTSTSASSTPSTSTATTRSATSATTCSFSATSGTKGNPCGQATEFMETTPAPDNLSVTIGVNGSIPADHFSPITLVENPTGGLLDVSFVVNGTHGTTGSATIAIPKSAVPTGDSPGVYINGTLAAVQSYTQDADNYYVTFSTQFSYHLVQIEFSQLSAGTSSTATSTQSSSSSLQTSYAVLVGVVAAVLLTAKSLLRSTRRNGLKTETAASDRHGP